MFELLLFVFVFLIVTVPLMLAAFAYGVFVGKRHTADNRARAVAAVATRAYWTPGENDPWTNTIDFTSVLMDPSLDIEQEESESPSPPPPIVEQQPRKRTNNKYTRQLERWGERTFNNDVQLEVNL